MAKKKNRNNGNQDRSQQPPRGDQLTPEQKRQNWTNGKVDLAKQDDYNVVRQRTPDVALLVSLATLHDNVMENLRLNNLVNPNIDLDKYAKVVRFSILIKAMLDRTNVMANIVANRNYTTPYRVKGLLKSVRSMPREDLRALLNELVEMVMQEPAQQENQDRRQQKSPQKQAATQPKSAKENKATETKPAQETIAPTATSPAVTQAIPGMSVVASSQSAAPASA